MIYFKEPTGEHAQMLRAYLSMLLVEIAVLEYREGYEYRKGVQEIQDLVVRGLQSMFDPVNLQINLCEYLQIGTAHLLAQISNIYPDFCPSRLFISTHAEMLQAYEEQRDIRWMSITRQDPRILQSAWLSRFPNLKDISTRSGAMTPGV